MIFGGFSAGARGSMVTIDAIADMLPQSTLIRGLHDSGAYQDVQPITPWGSFTPFGEQCQRAFNLFQPPINAECSAIFQGKDSWKCLCGEFMLPHVITPSQVIIHQYDSYQVFNNLGQVEPKDWDPDMCAYIETSFKPRMLQTIQRMDQDPRHVSFGPACYKHGLALDEGFSTVQVNEITASDQLLRFFYWNQSDSIYSNCSGVNCESSCPTVELGPNSWCF